ncbi:MAG: hypothetical protein KF729_36460 [Sandaracinaceae bacterium]|nr:hypothetical protein [Sandaracinaceae bacterium]
MSARRLALACLLAGCGDGTIVIELDTPPSAGEVLYVQVAGAGVDPSRPLTVPSERIELTGAARHVCVTARGPAGDVNVRLRQCAEPACSGAADAVPRTHTATIEHGVYAGRTTNVQLGAFRARSHDPIERCAVRGCVRRNAPTYCRPDGDHYCEHDEDVPPALDGCDIALELAF